MEFANDGDLY
jgi:NIMA (never in mitosis gene a)-related kinase